MGLDAASIGSTSIHRAVRSRMRSLGLASLNDYKPLLESSRTEWSQLVEAVIVPETWFFRDPQPIKAFGRHVAEEWLPAHPAIPARLLSVGCATGEEPYSLVMALRDAGVPFARFEVTGIDISACALARAERAVYRRNSFRGDDLAFRERYFRPSEEGFVLDRAVRKSVRFLRGNLLGADFLPGAATYDFIFCRNLLIYFDRPTQQRAIEKLDHLLAPWGTLFVSPVEQPLALNHGFRAADIPGASACRRAGQEMRRYEPIRLSKRPPPPARFLPDGDFQPRFRLDSRTPLAPTGKVSPPSRASLETARRLADAGRLEEAAQVCEAHLRQRKGSAEAYYLLGLVRDAAGDARATDCYRKALYLAARPS